ncbi:hypothetical protein WJX77_002052 [Trebouxia sp. C0004]
MITRSEQLESKLPAPDMSTSPSGLNQAEQPRQSHPATVQAFNVARAVLAYIDGLPATPERFNLLTIRNAVGQGLGEAVLSIWSQCHSDASAVLQSNVDAVVAQVNAYAAAHGIHPTGSCMEPAAQQAASEFSIGNIHSVLAVGTSGPVFHARTFYGLQMALKIASLDSRKHHSLKHQTSCLVALRSLWGRCVPHVLLAGVLTGHGHGYGLGTTLLHERHPEPGDIALLPLAEEALRKVHSHSTPSPSLAQCREELCSLRAVFSLKIQ